MCCHLAPHVADFLLDAPGNSRLKNVQRFQSLVRASKSNVEVHAYPRFVDSCARQDRYFDMVKIMRSDSASTCDGEIPYS